MATKIEWTDETWNPVIGCSRVSPGCDHCYAVGVVHRQMSPQHVGLTVKPEGQPTDWTGEVRLWEPALTKPLGWRKPRRVFVNSLSDLFHPRLSDGAIARVFAVMALAPQHTFQVLTKRPQRMADLLGDHEFWQYVDHEMVDLGAGFDQLSPGMILPNVWLGTSIESDRYAFRADHLRRTPAAVRFISAEPLLGPLPSLDLTGIDWLIVGGESGPGARPMHPDWVRDLRDACQLDADTGTNWRGDRRVSFFFKQWGDWAPAAGWRGPDHHLTASGQLFEPGERLGMNHMDNPVAIHRWGKKAAGRELDSRTWDEMPGATS